VQADTDDAAVVAMFADPAGTPIAMMTTDVDFADNAPANPPGIRGRRRFDDADEFVTRDADEIRVAFEQLQVGPANTGATDPDEALFGAARAWQVFELDCCRSGDDESFHEIRLSLGGIRSRRYDDYELTGN
jgi:hypothetical protein